MHIFQHILSWFQATEDWQKLKLFKHLDKRPASEFGAEESTTDTANILLHQLNIAASNILCAD